MVIFAHSFLFPMKHRVEGKQNALSFSNITRFIRGPVVYSGIEVQWFTTMVQQVHRAVIGAQGWFSHWLQNSSGIINRCNWKPMVVNWRLVLKELLNFLGLRRVFPSITALIVFFQLLRTWGLLFPVMLYAFVGQTLHGATTTNTERLRCILTSATRPVEITEEIAPAAPARWRVALVICCV